MRRPLAVLAPAFFSLALVACSDDADTVESSDTTEEASSSDDEATTTTGEEGGGDEETTTTTDGTASGSGSGTEEELSETVCTNLAALDELDDSGDPSEEEIQELVSLVEEARDEAPEELAGALDLFLGFIDEVVTEAGNNGGDFDAASETVFSGFSEEETDAFFQASVAIDEASAACGISEE